MAIAEALGVKGEFTLELSEGARLVDLLRELEGRLGVKVMDGPRVRSGVLLLLDGMRVKDLGLRLSDGDHVALLLEATSG